MAEAMGSKAEKTEDEEKDEEEDGGNPGEEGDDDGEAEATQQCGVPGTLEHRIVTGEEPNANGIRFDIPSSEDCPGSVGFLCTCESLCQAEIDATGNTQDHAQTIIEQASEQYEIGTPDHNELVGQLTQQHLSECVTLCETTREETCDCSVVSGPATLAPGESAEYVCSDGTTGILTMPEDACGTKSGRVGCCLVYVRSTSGHWECDGSCTGTNIRCCPDFEENQKCYWEMCYCQSGGCHTCDVLGYACGCMCIEEEDCSGPCGGPDDVYNCCNEYRGTKSWVCDT